LPRSGDTGQREPAAQQREQGEVAAALTRDPGFVCGTQPGSGICAHHFPALVPHGVRDTRQLLAIACVPCRRTRHTLAKDGIY